MSLSGIDCSSRKPFKSIKGKPHKQAKNEEENSEEDDSNESNEEGESSEESGESSEESGESNENEEDDDDTEDDVENTENDGVDDGLRRKRDSPMWKYQRRHNQRRNRWKNGGNRWKKGGKGGKRGKKGGIIPKWLKYMFGEENLEEMKKCLLFELEITVINVPYNNYEYLPFYLIINYE